MVNQLVDAIIQGKRSLTKEQAKCLVEEELTELCNGANRIRNYFCGNRVSLCSIINGKSGRCGEDCKYCAQSVHYKTGVEEYPFIEETKIIDCCKENEKAGVHRFSVVTSGRKLSGEELEKAVHLYKKMAKECKIQLCASHGLESLEELRCLKEAGVTRYHANIETSPNYFSKICTTHSFADKVQCIKDAKKVGLEVCSGGIIGMGETMEDRIDMALELAKLEVDSIPINVLTPIPGTPLESVHPLSNEEILRTLAILRFINPRVELRLAAGRIRMEHSGEKAFKSGVNATITGNMLTTSGNNIEQDKEMLTELGFDITAMS